MCRAVGEWKDGDVTRMRESQGSTQALKNWSFPILGISRSRSANSGSNAVTSIWSPSPFPWWHPGSQSSVSSAMSVIMVSVILEPCRLLWRWPVSLDGPVTGLSFLSYFRLILGTAFGESLQGYLRLCFQNILQNHFLSLWS